MGLVIVQPDLGTSLLIAMSGIVVLWFAGINQKYFKYGLQSKTDEANTKKNEAEINLENKI